MKTAEQQKIEEQKARDRRLLKSVAAGIATSASTVRIAAAELQTNPARNDAGDLVRVIQRESARLAEIAKQFPAPVSGPRDSELEALAEKQLV